MEAFLTAAMAKAIADKHAAERWESIQMTALRQIHFASRDGKTDARLTCCATVDERMRLGVMLMAKGFQCRGEGGTELFVTWKE